jgi:hypothetical protein
MQRKATRSIRKLIYFLKKRYGFQITLCRPTITDFNFETGKETIITSFKIIKKVVLLPSKFIDVNTEAIYRKGSRYILIDYNDIKTIGIERNDVVLFDEMAWRVKEIENYELKTLKIVELIHIKGAPYIDPLNPNIETLLSITQGVSNA